MKSSSHVAIRFDPETVSRARLGGHIDAFGDWEFECRDRDGNLKWRDTIDNIVVNQGLGHLLDVALSGGSQITTWYLGLIDGSPTVAAGDTLGSHAGWAEVTEYDEETRPQWTDDGVSNQSVSNSGAPAQFSINDAVTIGGAFLASDNTIGGTAGTLYAAGAFTAGDKSVGDGDTLTVTATFTAAAAS